MADLKEVRGEIVVLDHGEFVDTHFIECTLVYKGGRIPLLKGNYFDRCKWHFENEAFNTLAFLKAIMADEGGRNFVLKQIFEIGNA